MQLLCICNRSAEEIIGFCAQKLYALELILIIFIFTPFVSKTVVPDSIIDGEHMILNATNNLLIICHISYGNFLFFSFWSSSTSQHIFYVSKTFRMFFLLKYYYMMMCT